MASGIVYGNPIRLPSIDYSSYKKELAQTGDILILMSMERFSKWLGDVNKKARPISVLIKEYEDSRTFKSKRR